MANPAFYPSAVTSSLYSIDEDAVSFPTEKVSSFSIQNENGIIRKQDVLCGQEDKATFSHAGNKRYRFIISKNHERYKNASHRDKARIIRATVESIRSNGARFLTKLDSWEEVSNEYVHEKVGRALQRCRGSSPKKRMAPEENPIFQSLLANQQRIFRELVRESNAHDARETS